MQKFEIIDGVCVIPDGVAEIPSCAFEGCAELTKIVIPETVVKIGPNAFHLWLQELSQKKYQRQEMRIVEIPLSCRNFECLTISHST